MIRKLIFCLIFYGIIGERGQVVTAVGCGSTMRGFEPRRSPESYEIFCFYFEDFDGGIIDWYTYSLKNN